jgi:serine/threonine protein kinase
MLLPLSKFVGSFDLYLAVFAMNIKTGEIIPLVNEFYTLAVTLPFGEPVATIDDTKFLPAVTSLSLMFTAATEGSVTLSVPRHVGSYSLTHLLGRGQSSVVFSGVNTFTGAEYAIKVLSHSSFVKTNQIRRLNRELQALQELDHPNICKCVDILRKGDLIFIVMVKCGCEDLFTWLTRRSSHSKRELLRIFRDIVEGLAHVHRLGWSHCDIKLENVVIDADGRARLIDFGYAKHTRLAGDDEKSGTVLYSAPELFASGAFCPQMADVWSLGIVLFALATGRLPFPATDNRTAVRCIKQGQLFFPKVMDAGIEALVRRMTAFKPSQRPTVDEILMDNVFAEFTTKQNKTERLLDGDNFEAAFFMC